MDYQKFVANKCRVCMGENVELDWNDYLHENMTYKDYYYRWTQLDCIDEHNFYLSNMLCRNCSNNLENINAFISKAIETHNFLLEHYTLKIEIKDEIDSDVKANFETILISENDIEQDIKNIPILENKKEDSFDKESDAWSLSDDTAIPKKQTRTRRKRKLITKAITLDSTETSSNKLQCGEPIMKKKNHCSKPWEIPTCCTICSKVLASKYKAIAHEKTHLENRVRNQICPECGMKFFTKCALQSHMRTHVQNREKSHKCEFCDKAFYKTGDLNVHRRIHLGQMIKCNICSKEYFRQVDLEKHMISHSATRIDSDLKLKKKYFVCCEICGENVRSYQYKSHTARHMNEPLAKCAICNKEFFSRASCVTHLKKVHKKGTGECKNLVIAYKTNRYSNLFLQQNVGNVFIKE